MSALLGIGCDIVRIERIANMARRNPDIFLARIFGEEERAWLGTQPDWRCCARHVAAKEATFKALGTGLTGTMQWADVQVVYGDCRAQLQISGDTYRRMRLMGGTNTMLCMTSDGHSAMATVLLTGRQTTPV
jgi:holo-[acyl-carrier protein] synthase